MRKYRTKLYVIAILILALLHTPLAYAGVKYADRQKIEFLRAQGNKLFLGDQEFRALSFNYCDLFERYLERGWEYTEGDEKGSAKKDVAELGRRGYRMLRTRLPFYTSWLNEVFFDENAKRQEKKHKVFFRVLDELRDDCRKQGILLVISLLWNADNIGDLGSHSLYEGLKPESRGYQRFKKMRDAVVERYSNDPTIGMWEIGNEWDLYANLQRPNGVIDQAQKGHKLWPENAVRDAGNNFSTLDLVNFYRLVTTETKAIDRNHLVTMGNAFARPSAMHLLGSIFTGKNHWMPDDDNVQAAYISLLEQYADVIQVHYYEKDFSRFSWYVELARRMHKPLMFGEIGSGNEAERLYSSEDSLHYLDQLMGAIKNNNFSVGLLWAYTARGKYSKPDKNFILRYGVTDRALERIEKANRELSRGR